MTTELSRASVDGLFAAVRNRRFDLLIPTSIEKDLGRQLAELILPHQELYEPLLLGTATLPRRFYDWNIGFILPHLNLDWVTEVIVNNQIALARSEGIAWALGEAGSDDDRIVDFLYSVCEQCLDYDAWWCAAEALEKIGICDATDLKKRTLRGEEWEDLHYCLRNLHQRPGIIGALRLASLENTQTLIIPECREALRSSNERTVQNAVWLLERLRVDDEQTLESLYRLYEAGEDKSTTLRPRVVEAFGQIAAPATRLLLETALREARYYRTRAYAAMGLGNIGDSRSLPSLVLALSEETDSSVIGHITKAIYSISTPSKKILNQLAKGLRWPENGMISDESNDWYANPQIYDTFAHAEDPLGVSLDLALTYIPMGANSVADLGTGTGRFALFAAERRPDFHKIYALDSNETMYQFFVQQLRFAQGFRTRIEPVLGDLSSLPFPDASLDAVVSSWAFPSNMWNPDVCLRQVREVRRVLKDGGTLVTVGWDETFRDQLSELWYRFVPEPTFRRESIEEWRKRRRDRIHSARNCFLTFVKRNLRVPLVFDSANQAATILGYLFGFSAGEWVSQQQRCEFSIHIGITSDTTSQLENAIVELEKRVADSGEHVRAGLEENRHFNEQVVFRLNEIFKLEETRRIEFKEIKGQNPVASISNSADEYAVALLNSEGGSVYWGIRNEDRVIVGVNMTYEQRDQVRRSVSAKLAQIMPTVSLGDCCIDCQPVLDSDGAQIPDKWVWELTVPSGSPRELYATGSGCVWVKTDGGKQRLNHSNVIAEVRRRSRR